jgi:hypothetical protein
MPKFCSNGHQMEGSWEICPYCPKPGYAGGATPGRTRLEEPSPESSSSNPPGASRPTLAANAAAHDSPVGRPKRTVLMSEKKRLPVVGWLVAMNGNHKGEDFRLHEGQNFLGAAPDCDVVLTDDTVSSKHASLRVTNGQYFLTDLDSSNGSYLNDEENQISKVELKDNDIIRLGEVKMKFKCL